MGSVKSDLYKDAGVDIDLAQKLLKKVKSKISDTRRPEMLAPIGGFGGLFQLDVSKYKKPVMVSSIDGVGTKLMIAAMMNKYDTVGHDIVNHCINDISVQGAEPISFLDYIGIGKLQSPLYENVLEGIADACKAQNCAILGGETAEMPGMYGDDFDLVGVINGLVEKDNIITGEKIKPGYIAIGIASNGLHTNGYSLARKVLFDKAKFTVDTYLDELGETVGEALIKPHICYWTAVKKAMESKNINLDGIAHITGGGLYDNTPRILPDDVDVLFNSDALPVLPIFKLIVEKGNIKKEEAYRVFNMGIGMVWFVPKGEEKMTVNLINSCGFNAAVCGKVIEGTSSVKIN